MITNVMIARYQVQIFLLRFEKNGENSGIRLAMMMGIRIILIHRKSYLKPRKIEGKRSLQCSVSGLKAISVTSLNAVNSMTKITSRLKTQSKVLGKRNRKSIKGYQFDGTAKKRFFRLARLIYSVNWETYSLSFVICIARLSCSRFYRIWWNGIKACF